MDGGKGSAPRPIPDRAGYEANWDGIDWNARLQPVPDAADKGMTFGVQGMHVPAPENGNEDGAGSVQPDAREGLPAGPRG